MTEQTETTPSGENTDTTSPEPSEALTEAQKTIERQKEKIAKMDETIKRNFADAEAWRKYQQEQKPLEEQRREREEEALKRVEAAERKASIAEVMLEYELPKQAQSILEVVPVEEIETKAKELAELLPEPNQGLKPNRTQGRSVDPNLSAQERWKQFIQDKLPTN